MPNWGYLFLNGTWLAALAVWLGGTAFVLFVAAPTTFALLPTRAEAGRVVGAMLRRFERWVIACLVVLAVAGGIRMAVFENPEVPILVRYALLAGAAFLAVVGALWVSPRLTTLREALGAVDAVPEDDPQRVAFRRLHGVSMLLAVGQLVLGLGVLYLS